MFILSKTLKYNYILMVVLFLPLSASAAEVLTLQQAVTQMITHNRPLLIAGENVQQADAAIAIAQGQRLPHINASTGWIYTNSPLQVFGNKLQQRSITTADFTPSTLNNPSYQQNYQSRLGLRLPLFAGGALQAAQHQAEENAQAAALEFEFQKQQAIYQTIATYMQSLQYGQELETNKRSVDAAKKRWSDAKALQNKGIVLVSDVMDAHVYVLRRQVAVDEAANAYQASLEHLALLMGLEKPLREPALSLPVITMIDATLDSLLHKASERRMDFQALQSRKHALSSQREIAYSDNFPHIDLLADQEWNSATAAPKHSNTTVGLTISMNIFNGGSDHAKQRQAESAFASAQWEIANRRQLIGNQVRQAWRAFDVAKNKLTREQQVLQQTQESLRILSLRYQQGLETTSRVLDAQVAVDHSHIALLRGQSDLTIAKAALLLAAGLLNEGILARTIHESV